MAPAVLSESDPHLRDIKHCSRPSLQSRASPRRVAVTPGSLGLIRDSPGRSFFSRETAHCQKWRTLLVVQEGSFSLDARMGDRIIVRFYASPSDSSGTSEDQGGPLHSSSDSSSLAGKAMVSRVGPVDTGLSVAASILSRDGQIWYPNPAALRLWVWPLQSPSLSS